MISCTTGSSDETRELAAALAALAKPGDLILLVGELGAGKTVFAQGFGRGLGVTDRITSPTFALHNRYEGRLRLEHLDVYRLGDLDEVADLDLPELIDPGQGGDEGGVVLVEWGDTISPALPADYLEVRLVAWSPGEDGGAGEVRDATGSDDPERRAVSVSAVGPSWSARSRAMAEALAPWAGTAGEPEGGDS